jgi:hypothetical protein
MGDNSVVGCDFDRQNTLCFGTPQDIKKLLEYEVKTLGQTRGGLAFSVGIWGEVPPENIEVVVSGIEKLSTYWSEQ